MKKGKQPQPSPQQFPPGWDEKRVRKVLAHYEKQTEEEAVAEDEAAYETEGQTVMIVPTEPGQPGVVLELKVKSKAKGSTLERALHAAKKQLLEKDYAAELGAHGAAPIQQVAVAFDGKRVLVGGADETRKTKKKE